MKYQNPKLHIEKNYKVAFVLTSVTYGGLEKVSSCFLRNYNKHQFDIQTIVFHRPWQEDNRFIKWIEQTNNLFFKISSARHNSVVKKDFFKVLRRYLELFRLIKNGDFDLVHTNGTLADLTAIPIAKLLGLPCISTCHGFIHNDLKLKFYNIANKILLRLCSKVIAVSEELRDDLIKSGIDTDYISLIENAVSTEYDAKLSAYYRNRIRKKLGFNNNNFVIGFIGRLSHEKGCQYLIEAIFKLKELKLPVKAVIIGEGYQKRELELLVKKYHVENEVVFAGFQNNIENWLPVLECFILPSLTEGTPMALLEAMAFGVPVIASRVGGVPNIINSLINGILVSPGKPKDIVDAVCMLYRNEPERQRLSKAANNTIKANYNINEWTSKIEKEYLKVLG